METVGKVQLGKKGITRNFIETLKSHFERHKNVKVSVLRSLCRDKTELKEIEAKIMNELGGNYSSRTIGYTIAIKRLRKGNK